MLVKVLCCLTMLLVTCLTEEEDLFIDPNDPNYYELTMNEVIHSLHNAGRVNGGFPGENGFDNGLNADSDEDAVETFLRAAATRPRRSERLMRAAKPSNFHFLPSRG